MSDQNAQLEKVLDHLDKIHAKCDAIHEDHGKLAARMDALESEREKEKADAEEREKADKARKDSDAEHARARADAVAASAIQRDMSNAARKRLEEIERIAPQFAEAQMRADAAYQALGLGQAPHQLYGEELRDYRTRLLIPLKKHSKAYADSAIQLVGDDTAFRVIEDTIINDAVEASTAPPPASAPLRMQESRAESGHIIRKFLGDPAVAWAPMMGGAVRFGRINAHAKSRQ